MSFAMNRILGLSAAFGLYDWWARRNLEQIHDVLIELADLRGNAEILDVGCGTGILSSRLAGTSEGLIVHGVDINPRMIRVARKRGNRRNLQVEYQVGTAVQLPYRDGQFDVVFSCLLFHLLDSSEKELGLREIRRVLRPGGRYVCAEFEKYPIRFWGGKLARYAENLIGAVGFDVHTTAAGPSITRSRPIVYRVMVEPE
jgi:ubiquinone/menaquinone biosynthesis C-methylase UbiE